MAWRFKYYKLLILFCTCGTFLSIRRGVIIENNYKALIIFQQVDIYLIQPVKTDVLTITLVNE